MWKKIGYVLIVITMIAAVEYFIGWSALKLPWTETAPTVILAAATLIFWTYLIRAIRVYRFFPGCPEIRPFVRLYLLHNVFVNLLPLQSGEVSFPILMKRYFLIPVRRSVSALLWMRCLDLHTLLLLGLVSVGLSGRWEWVLVLVPVWAILPLVATALWCAQGREMTAHDNKFTRRIKRSLRDLPQSRSLLLENWGWTLLNWSVKLATFAWILTIFAPVDYITSIIGAAGGELSRVLPVNAPASVGTYEAGIVAAMAPLGISLRTAVAGAVNLHLFVIGMSIVGAVISLLLPRPRQDAGLAVNG